MKTSRTIALLVLFYFPLVIKSQPVYSICTDTITETFGDITDDGGDTTNYQANVNCTTLIYPYCSDTISLWFSQFKTEPGHDSLLVYDGVGTLLLNHSGTSIPPLIQTGTGALYLVWNSDGSTNDSGFVGHWKSHNFSCFPYPMDQCCQLGISRVQIVDPPNILLDNITSPGGYHDFSCTDTFTLNPNKIYSLTVLTGFGYPELVKTWIDINDDKSFDSITELVYSDSNLTNHVGTFTFDSINIPPGTYGKRVSMRFMSGFVSNQPVQPCTNPDFGSVQDYLVGIEHFIPTEIKKNEFSNLNLYAIGEGELLTIRYRLENKTRISLEVFSIDGKLISKICSGNVELNGEHIHQLKLNESGIYLIKLSTDDECFVRKVFRD